jgi:putative ABC transport system permease protein
MTSWLKQYGSHDTNMRISAKASDTGLGLQTAKDEARVILRARRHVAPNESDNFDVETNSSLMSIWSNLSGTFFIAMIGIAAISMVVGGIVIMNIMLVAVTERTREIGVRKAMGARRNDVLQQFLIEASILALVGGMIGVVLGITVAKTVTLLVGMPSSVPLWSIWGGLAVALSIGIFFGVYPARKAAMLDPITALRFET